MTPERQRLQSIDSEAASRLRKLGAGYTWFVRILRLTLPLVALVLIGIVVARLSADPEQQNITDLTKDTKTEAGQIALEKARYEGVDAEGRAYTLSAESAARDPEVPDAITLTVPHADITLSNGEWLAIESQTGVYDNAASTLSLSDKVRIFHDSGNEMHLEDLRLDLKSHDATSEKSVNAQGPLGLLSAAGLSVTENGQKIVFNGPVSLTLYIGKGDRG